MNPLEALALRYIADEWTDKDKETFWNLSEADRLKFIYYVTMHSPKRN